MPEPLYKLPPPISIGGVGLILTTDSHGNPIVDGLLDGFPAASTGLINIGDILFKVGILEVIGMPLDSVVNLVTGLEGTEVDLIFIDSSTHEEKKVTVERKALPSEEDALQDGTTEEEPTEEPTEEQPEDESTEEPPPTQEEEICPKCDVPYSECGCPPPDN